MFYILQMSTPPIPVFHDFLLVTAARPLILHHHDIRYRFTSVRTDLGGQSLILFGTSSAHGAKFVLKVQNPRRMDEPLRTHEIRMLNHVQARLRRSCILVRHVFEIPITSTSPEKTYGILMPFYPGGDLFEDFRAKLPLTEREIAHNTYVMLAGVRSFHGEGLVHGDIKPDNFLLDRSGWAYLSDFATAMVADADGRVEGDMRNIGTSVYFAPEQWGGGVRRWTRAVDVWAIGCSLFLFATNDHPFGFSERRGGIPWFKERWIQLEQQVIRAGRSPLLCALIKWLMTPEEELRPTAEQAMEHEFFRQFGCQKLVNVDLEAPEVAEAWTEVIVPPVGNET
jgi:serine/threonine protein kinase